VTTGATIDLPEPPANPPYPPSLDTRQQPHNGCSPSRRKVATRRLHRVRPRDDLTPLFNDPRERALTKYDLADVLEEVGRRAAAEYDYQRGHWFDERAAALRDCNQVRVFIHRGRGHGVATPMSCHVRGCPDCERSRVGRLVLRFGELAAAMTRPVFWTWTVRNVPAGYLGSGILELKRDFGRLRRRALVRGARCRWTWRDGAPGHPCHPPVPAAACGRDCPTRTGRRASHCPEHPPAVVHVDGCPPICPHHGHARARNCPDFAHRAIAGGVSAVEVTWSTTDASWHPHIHALVDAPWIAWGEMRDHWVGLTCRTAGCRHVCTTCRGLAGSWEHGAWRACEACAGGQHPRCTGAWSVWVEPLPVDEAARAGAIREVLKYVGKPAGITDSLDPDRIGEFIWSTRALKAVSGWGDLFRIGADPASDGLEREDEHVIRFAWMTWRVPKICPHCHEETTADDWTGPLPKNRLDAVRMDGHRLGWVDPPPLEAPPPPHENWPVLAPKEASLWH
jgi:hypothetical protein